MSEHLVPSSSVAVVKPDHIGDFVLAVPALRALRKSIPGFDLIAAPGNRFLFERYIVDGVNFRPLELAHLTRSEGGLDVRDCIEVLKQYSTTILLRNDGVMDEICTELGSSCRMIATRNDVHESELHRDAVAELVGDYSRSALLWGEEPPAWPTAVRTVGISLSAGFTSNKLPLATWLDLARRLADEFGIVTRVIGGPQEASEVDIACRMLAAHGATPIVGSTDLDAFFAALAECDVVVGADSGSLHLISTTLPVVGVFTSSPWRRFAPFGRHVRVVFAPIPCSPCLQYSPDAFNACVTRECAGLITTDDLLMALLEPAADGISSLSPSVRLVTAPAIVASTANRA